MWRSAQQSQPLSPNLLHEMQQSNRQGLHPRPANRIQCRLSHCTNLRLEYGLQRVKLKVLVKVLQLAHWTGLELERKMVV